MKYIITFSMVLVLYLSGMAQTGLVFSQCLTFGGAANVSITGDPYSPAFIVPDGKVWKIEYGHVDRYNDSSNKLLVNNTVAALLSTSISQFPIWVKAGDEIRIRTSAFNAEYFLSIMEFNVN